MSPSPHRLTDAPDLCRLLDRPVPAVVATTTPSGGPQASLIWVERRGEDLAFFAREDAVKVGNIIRNASVAFVVQDQTHELAPGVPVSAQLVGHAVVGAEEAGMVDRLARSYGQVDGWHGGGGPFCTVRVTITRVSGMGPYPGHAMGGWHPTLTHGEQAGG